MKINPIKNLNTNTQSKRPTLNSHTTTYNKETSGSLSSNITIGRSLVNFKQRKFEFIKEDQVFIKNLSDAFHFGDNEAMKLENTVISFMNKQNIKNLDEIGDDSQIDKQVALLTEITETLNLDEEDANIILTEIAERTINKEDYSVKPDIKYKKDFQAINQICKEYNISDKKISSLFDYLKTKAQKRNLNSIFDLFNKSKNPYLNYDISRIQSVFSIPNIDNIVIDMGVLAQKETNEIYKKTLTNDKFDIFLKDFQNKEICSTIIDLFELTKENTDFIINCLQKRELPQEKEKGKHNFEIAYTISDNLNLPEQAEQFILEILKQADKVSYKELKFTALNELLDNPIE